MLRGRIRPRARSSPPVSASWATRRAPSCRSTSPPCPRTCSRLAAQIGDGVMLWLCSPAYIRDVVCPRSAPRARRPASAMEGFDIVAAVPVGADRRHRGRPALPAPGAHHRHVAALLSSDARALRASGTRSPRSTRGWRRATPRRRRRASRTDARRDRRHRRSRPGGRGRRALPAGRGDVAVHRRNPPHRLRRRASTPSLQSFPERLLGRLGALAALAGAGVLDALPAAFALSFSEPLPFAMPFSSFASSFRASVPPRLSTCSFALSATFLRELSLTMFCLLICAYEGFFLGISTARLNSATSVLSCL